MSLPDDMRRAADTLEKASARYGYHRHTAWEPDGLRKEADMVEDEDLMESAETQPEPEPGSLIERMLNHHNKNT